MLAMVIPSPTQLDMTSLSVDKIQIGTANTLVSVPQIAQLGKGEVNDLVWIKNGDFLAISTTAGVWVQRVGIDSSPLLYDEHMSIVTDIDYDLISNTMASSGVDGTVKLWSPTTLEAQHTLQLNQKVRSVKFSPDGQTIATISGESIFHSDLKIWDANTGLLRTQLIDTGYITGDSLITYIGENILALTHQSSVHIWDIEDNRKLFELDHDANIRDMLFAPDSSTLMVATENGSIYRWDTETDLLEGRSVFIHEAEALEIIALVDENHIIYTHDHDVYLIDIQTQATTLLLTHTARIKSIAFEPGSELIAIATAAGTVEIWDTSSHERRTALDDFGPPVVAMSVSQDNTLVATAHRDGTVVVWDWTTQQQEFVSREFLDVSAVSLNQHFLAIGGFSSQREYVLVLLDYQRQQEIARWAFEAIVDQGNGVLHVELSGNYLTYLVRDLYHDEYNQLGVIDLSDYTQHLVPTIDQPDAPIPIKMHFIMDGTRLIVYSTATRYETGTFYVLNTDLLDVEREIPVDEPIGRDFAVDETGNALAFTYESGNIALLRLDSAQITNRISDPAIRITSRLALEPTGTILAAATPIIESEIHDIDDYIVLWDLTSGNVLARLEGHTASIYAIEFTGDGQYLLSGSYDGTVRIWHLTDTID